MKKIELDSLIENKGIAFNTRTEKQAVKLLEELEKRGIKCSCRFHLDKDHIGNICKAYGKKLCWDIWSDGFGRGYTFDSLKHYKRVKYKIIKFKKLSFIDLGKPLKVDKPNKNSGNELVSKLIDYTLSIISPLGIKVVYHNKEKGTTCVIFNSGKKVIVKRKKGAVDDVYTAVAYAYTKYLYKRNTIFIEEVDKKLDRKEK